MRSRTGSCEDSAGASAKNGGFGRLRPYKSDAGARSDGGQRGDEHAAGRVARGRGSPRLVHDLHVEGTG